MPTYKERLLRQLHSPRAAERAEATDMLWHWWFSAAGAEGARLLQEAEALMAQEAYDACEAALTHIIKHLPDFAGAWNRRATLRFLRRQYAASLADCHEVLQREPQHFGAWHGQGLCQLELHQYDQALASFRRALDIQPYALTNLELMRDCQAKLN